MVKLYYTTLKVKFIGKYINGHIQNDKYLEDDKYIPNHCFSHAFTPDNNYVFLSFRYGELIGVCLSSGDICFEFNTGNCSINMIYIDKNYKIYVKRYDSGIEVYDILNPILKNPRRRLN